MPQLADDPAAKSVRPGSNICGAQLAKIEEQLKAHKLTFRNVPMNNPPADGTCIFTGEPAVERIFVARAY